MTQLFPLILAATESAAQEADGFAAKFGLDLPYFIAQCLHILIVMGLLYFFAFKPVLKTLKERQDKIADGLRYADEMKSKLDDAEAQHAARLKEASNEAQKIIHEARQSAEAYLEKQSQQAAAQAEDIVRKAREATERERDKMLDEVRGEIAQLVVLTTEKVLAEKLPQEQRDSFAQAAATELAGRN